ncbi:hypothetical protein P170DRAFT_432918 [Aspergillus steynii IBT 23096]|uniref:Uncharacterized protein n=1 Tax=Aspergillus steynii IBT 23096 TaxID=1392250 RepID=A0A2I2GR66_9EURO|nr:uncharacterized protein P170DRAFT_432918 [Aspergillus steynii IBT 23096]PLB55376.1 hypothetical protein P170DRAFT_432918 [Aspergillus steynii IBT 23096]
MATTCSVIGVTFPADCSTAGLSILTENDSGRRLESNQAPLPLHSTTSPKAMAESPSAKQNKNPESTKNPVTEPLRSIMIYHPSIGVRSMTGENKIEKPNGISPEKFGIIKPKSPATQQ